MITIALYDPNEIYSQSLKTLLEQIDDFRVVLVPPSELEKGGMKTDGFDILLVDSDLSASIHPLKTTVTPFREKDILLLATYHDEVENSPDHLRAIMKNAGKHEFEKRIRAILLNRSKYLAP